MFSEDTQSNWPNSFNICPLGGHKLNENLCKKYVYIFNLSGDKKFLYSSFPKNENEIILEATIYYDYLKTFPIISLYEKREERTGFDIDTYTKEYMYYYGIDNIRGGSYSSEILSKEVEKVLLQELKTVDNFAQKPKEYLLYLIIDYYKTRLQNKNEIYKELENVNQRRTQYRIEKTRLESLKPHIPSIYLFEDRLKELLSGYKAVCHTEDLCVYMDRIQKYKPICKQIKQIYTTICHHFPEKIDRAEHRELATYYENPEFLFDNFIYRGTFGSLEKVCNTWIYFANIIINRIAEYEFDIASYSGEDEWVFSRRIFYLQHLLRNC